MDEMVCNVELKACWGFPRQFHLGREKGKDSRDKVTDKGQPEQNHTTENTENWGLSGQRNVSEKLMTSTIH